MEERLKELKGKYHHKETELHEISKIEDTAKSNYQKRLKSLKTQKLTLKDKIFSKDVEVKLQKLEAGLHAYKSASNEFETLAKDAIIDREEMKEKYIEVKNENGRLKKQNEALTAENKALNNDIKTLKERITEIQIDYKKAREALKNSGVS